MKEIRFYTEFPCLIVTESKQVFLSPCDILSLSANEYFICPLDSSSLHPFKINFANKIGKNYRIIKHEEKDVCLLFSPKFLTKKSIEKQKVAGINITISLSRYEIMFSSNTQELSCPIDFPPIDYLCKVLGNFSVVHIKNKAKERIFIFNPNNSTFKTYNGKDFDFATNMVSFTQTYQDFASSLIKKKITFEKDSIKEEVISSEVNSYKLSPQTICFGFLDCLLQDNLCLAKKLLADHLANIEDEKFKEYFGKFHSFFPLNKTTFVLIYQETNKIIRFDLNEDKINEFHLND